MNTFVCPEPAHAADKRLTPQQQLLRAQTVSQDISSSPSCTADVHIGVFFDGTNNNKRRDQEMVADPNARSHSNVVVLHDTFANKRERHYRIYIPGVGTPFPEIGELAESREGKSMARGGEARIFWGMIQVINAIHLAALDSDMVQDDEAKKLINGPSFLSSNSLISPGSGRRRGVFSQLISRLALKLKDARPRIKTAHLSVFGFSRGAAQARAFCNWMTDVWDSSVERGGFLCRDNVPKLRFQFVGIFDTVASVGLANSAPIPNDGGFMSWADGTMELPSNIEHCVHYTAAHEIRKSFPLSTGRKSLCTVREVIYPGAHSDVGGGYAPKDQGKGVQRADLLSQVSLVHMYQAARRAGVPLADMQELEAYGRVNTIYDLKLSSKLVERFNAYRQEGPKGGEIKSAMREHLRWYWRWRISVGERFASLASFNAASAQDKEDLGASEKDFRRDIAQAIKDREDIAYRNANPVVTALGGRVSQIPVLSEAERIVLEEIAAKNKVSALVSEFFDHHVHDSHASFYLLGPVTAHERKLLIDSIAAKQKNGEKLNGYERRVAALQVTNPGELPVMSDGDYEDLLDMEDFFAEKTIRTMTATRRESEGHVRERVIFDKS